MTNFFQARGNIADVPSPQNIRRSEVRMKQANLDRQPIFFRPQHMEWVITLNRAIHHFDIGHHSFVGIVD